MSFTAWLDSMSVCFRGGVRIRIVKHGDAFSASGVGQTIKRMPAERLAQLVAELKPESAGTIDVQHHDGFWKIQASPSLDKEGIVQRNVLVNSEFATSIQSQQNQRLAD